MKKKKQKNTRTISNIDIAIPNDANSSRKRNDKITYYTNLSIGLKQLLNLRSVKTVANIIGACGAIHKKFEMLICKKLDRKINTNNIPNIIVLLGTSNISGYTFSTNF